MTTMVPPPTGYERSAARRKFLLALAARLTAKATIPADQPDRQGDPEPAAYSATAEHTRVYPRSTIA